MPAPIYFNSPPNLSETHLCCDFVELLCLINRDKEISRADIADRLREMQDVDRSVEEIVEDDVDPNVTEVEDEVVTEKPPTEINDRLERRLTDWFSHIRHRSGIFREFYPFRISEDDNVIKTNEVLSDKQNLYVFFLLASNLRYVRKFTDNITRCFEAISQQTLRRCLPSAADVHIFGTSSGSSGRYSGNKWKKVKALAKDVRADIILPEEKFSRYDVGDGGLDIVAWVPTGDEARSLFCVFGQCACTEEWVSKQFSSSSDAWASILSLHPRPYNVVFIPFCYRDARGDWFDHKRISQSVIMDRVRMLYLLAEDYEMIKSYPAFRHIEEVVAYSEDIV